LDGQSRNAGNAIAFVGGDGLDVGGNSGARGRIEAGDRQHHGWRHSHIGSL
jgi:hypothetical protein